jgi:hypothetical protein
MGGSWLDIPGAGTAPDEETVAFAAELTDRSGKAPVIEAALAHRTGRPRPCRCAPCSPRWCAWPLASGRCF